MIFWIKFIRISKNAKDQYLNTFTPDKDGLNELFGSHELLWGLRKKFRLCGFPFYKCADEDSRNRRLL